MEPILPALNWKPLELYSILNNHLSSCPVTWNAVQKKLEYNRNRMECFWWYFNVYGIGIVATLGSIFLILLNQMISPVRSVPGMVTLYYILACFTGLIVGGIAVSISISGEISVLNANGVFSYHEAFLKGEELTFQPCLQ